MSPALRVIIVTYNSGAILSDCLNALFQSDFASPFEVWCVDNNSTDNTLDVLRSFEGIRVVESGANLGFAKAVNSAIDDSEVDYLLLNPDAVVAPDTLRRLHDVANSDERIAIVGPRITHPKGRLKTESAGHAPTIRRMFNHYSGLSRAFPTVEWLEGHYLLPNGSQSQVEVDWVTGACLYIKSQVVRDLGALSEKWFMYAEDIEYCLRARKAGWQVRFAPSISCTHLVGESSGVKSANPAWVLNLRELYIDTTSAGPLRTGLWTGVVAGGLLSRAIMYWLLGVLRSSKSWKAESKRFALYARSLVTKYNDA
ncbi:glycosyltransferase family 2 protein [Timonella senegalensis]|uniref:glycosyltransferase family 2 protein n=1 Tax=Timonella senegalensis TaxID=1465825 RepID=UPI002FDD23EE